MIWILCALVAGAVWALWFILQLKLWIPLVATAVIGAFAIGLFIYRFFSRRRAAAGLEKAIEEQGKKQAMNARPEKRAEIQALQKQILDGIKAIKSSKLGGKKRGSGALYSLPWYAIIGPPGAGKTTAIKHSGLVFPYADTSVRGVGGTRNCDWWFTNEAILLDTAGRYATEQEDQQEWLSFLQMLLKYRKNKPLNGLLVAVSVTDIIDSNEAQIEEMAKKLRARIDEVMTKLRMVLPVYMVVTKCDLVAGFIEFFGDLRKSQRAQAWGSTIKIKEKKIDPGGIFQREFDTLVQHVHGRAVKRLAQERNREARERIFQFPLEFAGIKRNLSELISTLFMVNTFQGTPLLRGVYFTSGTQEGRPLDRVLGRMGQAMGIQMPQQAAHAQVESKSYFLHDVFMNIVFPDADVAARSAAEIRRKRLVRIGVSAAAMSIAGILAIPSGCSFFKNTDLLEESQKRAKKAARINWTDGRPVTEKLKALTPLRKQLEKIDEFNDDTPLDMTWLMYQGDNKKFKKSVASVFVAKMQQGFVRPCKHKLGSQLMATKGERYLTERLTLKKFLMLHYVEHLDVEWATGVYTNLWAELRESTSNVGRDQLKKLMRPHVAYYFKLLKAKRFTPVALSEQDQSAVTNARKILSSVPVRKRYYAMFVDVVSHQKYNPAGDNSRSNKMFPPVTLEVLFTDRPKVLKWLSSKTFLKTKTWLAVPGPYTAKGGYAVLSNVKSGIEVLKREAWVVPLSKEEKSSHLVAKNVANVAEDYEQKYIGEWKKFLMDLELKQPADVKEAIALYDNKPDGNGMRRPEWPLLRILRNLEDHTQWKLGNKVFDNKRVNQAANRRINESLTKRIGLKLNIDVKKKIGGKVSEIPSTFKKVVGYGFPQESANAPLTETALAKYMERIGRIREKMVAASDKDPNVKVQVFALDLRNAMKETDASLEPFGDLARMVLKPLLVGALNVGGKIRPTATVWR